MFIRLLYLPFGLIANNLFFLNPKACLFGRQGCKLLAINPSFRTEARLIGDNLHPLIFIGHQYLLL